MILGRCVGFNVSPSISYLGPRSVPMPQSCIGVSARSGSVRPVRAAMAAGEAVIGAVIMPGGHVHLGSLADDLRSYREVFFIRCYEVGSDRTATIQTIANLMQESGCNHALCRYSKDGFGTTLRMRADQLIWAITRMHIEVYKYPAWREQLGVETWFQNEVPIGGRRDWVFRDPKNGEVTMRGSCKYVMMNRNTRRYQRMTDAIGEEYESFCPQPPRYAFPENGSCNRKIPKIEEPAHYSRLGLLSRRADQDMNQHVNNVTYIGWLLESIPQEILETHELEKITVDYRRECQHNDMVDSLSTLQSDYDDHKHINEGYRSTKFRELEQDRKQFLHLTRFSNNGLEINRGRTVWRRKLAR